MLDWSCVLERAKKRGSVTGTRAFLSRFEWMGLQRHFKVGIFASIHYATASRLYHETPRVIEYEARVAGR